MTGSITFKFNAADKFWVIAVSHLAPSSRRVIEAKQHRLWILARFATPRFNAKMLQRASPQTNADIVGISASSA
jgi:hypothetical protein